ncbi:MAG: phytoene desaturase family protein [Balneolaceae bacterium]|nr:phytoene desaturase family protein [Balneolaceae bacterium]
MKVGIIGAGLGGLSAGCLLAAEGHEVTIFEKNRQPGGKINQVYDSGFRFDTGPSLLTMPFVLEQLFERCGADIWDYLEINTVDPIARYFYPDGTRFDCSNDREKTVENITRIAPEDRESYRSFLDYSEELYDRVREAFLFNPLCSFSDLRSLNLIDFFKIDAFHTVSERVDEYFESVYLRQFFKRFTTYNGSSPYQAPATLNVIPHVELSMGGYYIDGGIYRLVTALSRLAGKLDVDIHYGATVKRIATAGRQVEGLVMDDGSTRPFDLVVSNSDASETYRNLLPEELLSRVKRWQLKAQEPSCSGFVILAGIDQTYPQLAHHNILFSSDYREEFRQIFKDRMPADEPTIYICNSSASNPGHAVDGGSNLFILVNAPYLTDAVHWESIKEGYADMIISLLEKYGLDGLSKSMKVRRLITPDDFYRRYRSNKGSIYGTSSNGKLAAFLRPRNRSTGVRGLYLVGGSTHPGGGIPLVTLSAFHACELIRRDRA